MATPMEEMPPPLLPAYSLRVQLFAPNSYGEKDKPIRCFRVVTSPEVTVRKFCEEASRIHEINYGHPISIKKVQDDQQFDITQAEILGSLFQSMSTIRVIQASAHPGVRDSLPPTSALRFEPTASKKREREGSVRLNGSNKRQRVASHDPDHPLPSRETEETNGHNIISNSQESVLGTKNDIFSKSRHVRTAPRRIPETPSPPAVPRNQFMSEKNFADRWDNLSDIQSLHDDTNLPTNTGQASTSGEASNRANLNISHQPRAKGASYHIPRATERGASVSTAATSPSSVDQQLPPHTRKAPANKRKRPETTLPKHSEFISRSPDEDSVYENITSDDEASAIIRSKKAILKQKGSPRPGLPGLDWTQNKLNTPPNGTRRSPASREPATTPGELPLTPKSKERQEKQEKELDEARKARIAAAEAAEQRRQGAEEVHIAKEERAKREEQERIETKNFQRGEAERRAAIVKAARLQRESKAREKKEAEQEKHREEAQVTKEKAEQERLEIEKATAAEAKRHRDIEEIGEQKAAELAEKERKAQKEAAETRLPSSSPEEARPPKFSTPILPRSNSVSRPQSGTSFFPSRRKSALKSSYQPLRSSSPAGAPDTPSNGVGVEAQMPLPQKINRRVSFQKDDAYIETPILPTTRRILPPSKTSTSAPPPVTPKKPANKPVAKPPLVQTKSITPTSSKAILPPKHQSLECNTMPAASAKILNSTESTSSFQVEVVSKKVSSPASSQPRKSETLILPPTPREMAKLSLEKSKSSSAEPIVKKALPKPLPTVEDEDNPKKAVSKSCLETAAHKKQASPLKNTAQEPENEGEEDDAEEQRADGNESSREEEDVEEPEVDDEETQSQNDSTRDSRSPVSFSQHPRSATFHNAPRDPSTESEKSSEDEEMEDADEPIVPTPSISKSTKPEAESSSQDEDQDEMEDVEETKPASKIADTSVTQSASESSPEDEDVEMEMEDVVKKSLTDKEDHTQCSNAGSNLESGSDGSDDSDDSDDSDGPEDEEAEAQVQIPESSPPVLPAHKSIKPMVSKLNLTQNGKGSPSEQGSQNTQDEIDQQLTSDIFEAHNPAPPVITAIPSSSLATRLPTIKFGASLSSLNQNRLSLGNSSQVQRGTARNGLSKPKLELTEDDEESESEEDSESENDSSSESEDDAPAKKRYLEPATPLPSKAAEADESDSDGSNSDADDKDEGQKIRDELAAQIAGMGASSQNSITIPSPKMYSMQQIKTPVKAKGKKNSDKFLTGYKFSVA